MNIWRKNNLCRVPAPAAHPGKVGLVQSWSFLFWASWWNKSNREANLVLLSERELPPRSPGYTGTFPAPANDFPNHSSPSPPQTLQEWWAPALKLFSKAPVDLPCRVCTHASHIEYCNNFPEREKGMGNAGIIIISSVVQQLSCHFLFLTSEALPSPALSFRLSKLPDSSLQHGPSFSMTWI